MERWARFLICIFSLLFLEGEVVSIQILSKSKLEKCEKSTDANDKVNCTTKIAINMTVSSGSSGGEGSIVAEIMEAEENSTNTMQTLWIPPVLTVNKSAAYDLYELTYILYFRDVSFKPQEFYVKTRKCEPDAAANVVKLCERLHDEKGHIIEHTQPICCPCGRQRRLPSSCGNIFDKLVEGKPNRDTVSDFREVIVGPKNRMATSNDNFLKVNLIGDFVGSLNLHLRTFSLSFQGSGKLATVCVEIHFGYIFAEHFGWSRSTKRFGKEFFYLDVVWESEIYLRWCRLQQNWC